VRIHDGNGDRKRFGGGLRIGNPRARQKAAAATKVHSMLSRPEARQHGRKGFSIFIHCHFNGVFK
jgi:hypothetical protein